MVYFLGIGNSLTGVMDLTQMESDILGALLWGDLDVPCEKWNVSRPGISDFGDLMDCSPPGSSVHGIFSRQEY